VQIGVLALQGDYARHAQALRRCSASRGASSAEASRQSEIEDRQFEVQVVEVRKPEQLDQVDGLIIPGGESTTLLRLLDDWAFVPALEKFHAADRPIFGTCAGAILLAREVESPRQFSLGFIDIAVERNAYGRQRESFVGAGQATLEGRPAPLEMVFIRAPRIRRVGPGVETLARHGEEPVLTRQGSVLAGTFHPELTDDPAVHRYFCKMAVRGEPRSGGEPSGEMVRKSGSR
jgi:pyridoxal 5'-phosphate synthase pdxT subunit